MTVVVSIGLGRIEGAEQGGVLVFRGIPYAAPPVGPLRFRAPEPPRPWHGVRDGRTPGPTAPQILGLMREVPAQSEDCLQLNVWTPALSGRRPVLVFLHGGAFTTGTSAHPMYDGRELARRGDAVVVSVNYRLGALGFADLGALGDARFGADANNGLRDQLAALAFVREHIAAFGGDPECVTLFGQSAGAMSVGTLLSLPASRGLFQRAIAQSGAAHHVTTRADSARIAERLLDALAIGPAQLDRLRALPFEAITRAQSACLRQWIGVGRRGYPLKSPNMTLLPVIDGELIAEPPWDAAASGAGHDVPLLLGSNADEWNFWIFLMDSTKRDLDDGTLRGALDKRVPGHVERAIDVYSRVHAYARRSQQRLRPWQIFSAIETDRWFAVPALRLAQARAQASAPTYLYRFDWTGALFEGQIGSCHTIEVPFVFGLVDEGFGRVFAGGGEAARALSERTMDAWIAFARGGDPSTGELGAWPRFDVAQPSAMLLSRAPRVESARLPDEIDALWSDLV
jgi:para-nitrobenzyl esterase